MISIISIIEGLLLIVPALLSVAFVTIAERKTMASMQRRLGPNAVGYYGLLQAFADALKLILKEYVAPTQANIILFFLGPVITLIFSLLGFCVIPFGSGLFISDFNLGILYTLAVSSLATYGILLAGWSANSKYAFLGSKWPNKDVSLYLKQTISGKFRKQNKLITLIGTLSNCVLRICVIPYWGSKVKILLKMNNPQVTKTWEKKFIFSHNNYNFITSFIHIYPNIQLLYSYIILNSTQFIKKFSSLSYFTTIKEKERNNVLHPYYVTGVTVGEGCFLINIRPNSKMKTGYSVELVFKLVLLNKDQDLIKKLQSYFGVGTVTKRIDGSTQYWVGSIKDLPVIINHFDSYPLISDKWSDYQLFKQVFERIKHKKHFTPEGLNEIVSIKSVLNNGLSNELKLAFPNTIVALRPPVKNKTIIDPHWISGFVDGEGCFYVTKRNSAIYKLGTSVRLRFIITQHSRDAELLKNRPPVGGAGARSRAGRIKYLECGQYYPRKDSLISDYMVTGFKNIFEKILPFFERYPLLGSKSQDLSDFKLIGELIKNKEHLTEKGLKEIGIISSRPWPLPVGVVTDPSGKNE